MKLFYRTEPEQMIGDQADVNMHGICCRTRRRIHQICYCICDHIHCCIHCRIRRVHRHNRCILIHLLFGILM